MSSQSVLAAEATAASTDTVSSCPGKRFDNHSQAYRGLGRDAKVAVIGGSQVGPAAEILLRSHGFDNVTTYDAMRTAFPQSGGVMGLRGRTIEILNEAGVPTSRAVALRSRSTTSFDMVNGEPRRRGSSELPGEVTSWDHLHKLLADRVDVAFNHRLTDVVHTAGERAELVFANGERVNDVDLIVFADGRKSRGRELLDPARTLEYQGYMVWRGLVDPGDLRPVGFERYYDTKRGTLFSITEPIEGSDLSYWEFSHNMTEETFTKAGGKAPTKRAFLLPHQITPFGRAVLDAEAKAFLPAAFRDLVIGTDEVMGIPINDLDTPGQAVWQLGDTTAVLAGDALMPVRLQTGMGLNGGIQQMDDLARRLAAGTDPDLSAWEAKTIADVEPWVELGRARASRTNLGIYEPVRPGYTAVPDASPWAPPRWVIQ